MKHNTPKKSSIEKALSILMAFTPDNIEMGTVELSQNLDLHPATVNRILKILSQEGFLRQSEQTRKFRLGPSVFHLGRTIFQSLSGNLLKIAVPYMENLAEELGETVILDVMSDKNAIVAYLEHGKSGYMIGPKIGDRVPSHAGAGAKAMLAFYNPDSVEGFLGQKLERFTTKTITDLQTFKLELEKIKRQGVAFCREEMAIGMNAIGVPIFDHDNKPVASLVVGGLASRVRCIIASSTVVALKRTASEISARIFHQDSIEKTV